MKSLEVSPLLLAFALNLMGLNCSNSKASGRGRSGAVPTALPAAHWGRWNSVGDEVVTVGAKAKQTRLNSEL